MSIKCFIYGDKISEGLTYTKIESDPHMNVTLKIILYL